MIKPNARSGSISSEDRRSIAKDWLIQALSQILATPERSIDENNSLESIGLDSAAAVALLCEIEEFVNMDDMLDAEILYEHNTVSKLSSYISELMNKKTKHSD